MRIKEGYVLKEVAKEFIVVPVGDEAINFNGILTLNKTAKLLFETLLNDVEIKDLVKVLLDKYDIDEEQALRKNLLLFRLEMKRLILTAS